MCCVIRIGGTTGLVWLCHKYWRTAAGLVLGLCISIGGRLSSVACVIVLAGRLWDRLACVHPCWRTDG